MTETVNLGVNDITKNGDWGEYGPISSIVDLDGNKRRVNFITELKALKHSVFDSLEKCGNCGEVSNGTTWILHVERGKGSQVVLACKKCNSFVWYGGDVS